MTLPDPMSTMVGVDMDSPEVECPVSGFLSWRVHVMNRTLAEIRDLVAEHLATKHATVIDVEIVR